MLERILSVASSTTTCSYLWAARIMRSRLWRTWPERRRKSKLSTLEVPCETGKWYHIFPSSSALCDILKPHALTVDCVWEPNSLRMNFSALTRLGRRIKIDLASDHTCNGQGYVSVTFYTNSLAYNPQELRECLPARQQMCLVCL